MDVFPLATGLRAIDPTLFGQEGAAQQRCLALGATEALICGVPVNTFVGHLGVVDA